MFKNYVLLVISAGIVNICPAQQYVDATGSCGGNIPCNLTIQSAVTAAAPGATITVYPGTYNEKVTIDKSLVLQSTGGAAATTIQYSLRGNYEAPVMIPAPASNVTLGGLAGKGFTIIGMDNTNDAAGAGQESGAIIIGAGATAMSNINISYNIITANGEAAILTYYSATNYLSNLSVTNNLINGKTFEGAAPVAGGPFTHYNAAKPAVAINLGAQNVTFSQNTVSPQTGAAGTGNSLVLINAAGSSVNENTFNGTIAGTSATLVNLRGTAATMQCNLLTLANAPGARYLLTTSGTAPYTPATVATTNTFLPATIYYFSSSFSNVAFGTAANSLDPAPGCNIPLPVDEILLTESRYKNNELKTTWESESADAGTVFDIQTACGNLDFQSIDHVVFNGSVVYEHQSNLEGSCGKLMVRIRQAKKDGTNLYSNIALVESPTGKEIVVYPNPVKDKLHIHTPDVDHGFVLLYDYTGRQVSKQLISGLQHSLDLSDLQQGIYLLHVVSGNNIIYSGKILK